MPTVFKKPLNNLTTLLGANYAPGSGTMTVRAGDGARFGTISTSSPIRFSVVGASKVTSIGQVAPPSSISIYTATGISGDILSGVAISEGTTDQAFSAGDYLAVVPTAATFADIQAAINALESGESSVSGQVATNSTNIATNTAGLAAHVADTANPHNVTAIQVGASVAQWNASALQGKTVDATAPSGGQGLIWNASTSKWVPGGPTWDAADGRLGIGTTTPGAPVHISGVNADAASTFWMTCGTSAGRYSSMLFGEGTALDTGDYAEMIRYSASSGAGFLPGDFGVTNLGHRLFFSTAYTTAYRIDLLVDNDGMVGIGPDSGLAAQLTVESKDAARPAIVARGAAGQTANLLEIQDSAGATLGGITAAGDVTAPIHDKGGQVHNVLSYGADPTGATPSTTAILAAQTAAGSTIPVYFPPGTYLVDDSLFDSLVGYSSYAWIGARSARGCNAGASFPASTIKFRPTDTTKWLVRAANTTSGQESTTIGPFVHRDLMFDVGDANGFQFGIEDINNDGVSDAVADGSGQAYINGVRFEGCAISATAANRASDASGVITRSGRILVHLTKCFESTLRDTSLYGGDTQIRTWGCDRPTLSGARFQGAHFPIDFNGSGTFTVQHSLQNVEIEGWTFTPIRSLDVNVSGADISLEQNDGAPTGSGRWAIPGTVAVTADSATLTFSQSMDGILWPWLSLVELTDGANTQTLLVTAVSGAAVTVDASTDGLGTPTGTSTNVITWTASVATATRIHGYGPLHHSKYSASYKSITCDVSTNCPSFVYAVDRGILNIAGGADAGIHSGIASIVLGNIPAGAFYMDGAINFSDSSPTILPPLDHPFVTVDHMGGSYSDAAYDANRRARYGNLFDAVSSVRRAWVFTPKRSSMVADGSYAHNPVIAVAGDPGTTQMVHAWLKRNDGGLLHCSDPTLPNTTGTHIRVRFRARSVGATGSLGWFFTPVNGGSFVRSVSLTDTWTNYDIIQEIPTEWTTGRSGDVAIEFNGSGYYLAAVLIEEITPNTPELISGNIGFFGATPVAQHAAIADATNSTDVITQLNTLLAYLRSRGDIAT